MHDEIIEISEDIKIINIDKNSVVYDRISSSANYDILVQKNAAVTILIDVHHCGENSELAKIINLRLVQPCASANFFALIRSNNHQKITLQLNIYSEASETRSETLIKAIANDQSTIKIVPKIHIGSSAGKSIALLQSHNLLLGDEARIDTTPILEILNDDVQCSHGATVSGLDANQLFYLSCRGIAKYDAEKMLTQAFVSEILNKSPNKLT